MNYYHKIYKLVHQIIKLYGLIFKALLHPNYPNHIAVLL